jgi:hypothetical protein
LGRKVAQAMAAANMQQLALPVELTVAAVRALGSGSYGTAHLVGPEQGYDQVCAVKETVSGCASGGCL